MGRYGDADKTKNQFVVWMMISLTPPHNFLNGRGETDYKFINMI